jgi:hypothetical protein
MLDSNRWFTSARFDYGFASAQRGEDELFNLCFDALECDDEYDVSAEVN